MFKYAAPIGARYSSIVIQFVVIAAVTRLLSQADAGHYFVIMGLVLATYFLAGAGLPDGIVRFAPAAAATGRTEDAAILIRRGYVYSLATVPLGGTFVGSITAIYFGEPAIAALSGAWWMSYGIIFVCAQFIVAGGRSELGTALFYSAASTGQMLISLPIILIFRLRTLDTILFAITTGTFISAAVCLVIAWRTSDPAKHNIGIDFSEAWRQGATIAAGRVVQSCFLWSPVWVVSLTLGPSDAALVGIACRLVSAVAAVIAAIRFSIRPALARDAICGRWQAIKVRSCRIAFYTTLLALAAIITTALVGDVLVAWAFGTEYSVAGNITALMLIGTLGESFGGPVDEILRMSGHATDVVAAQTGALALGACAQALAGWFGGLTALAVTYGLIFFLLYVVLIGRLWHLKGILVLPRAMRSDR